MNTNPASLDNLHDLVLPAPVPWWPPAPGWYVLFALISLVVAWSAWRTWKRWQANRYRRAALCELAAAEDATAIAELLRRTALAIVPRTVVASMSGTVWTDWLAAQCAETMPDTVRTRLAAGLYDRPETAYELDALRDYAARWISRHRLIESYASVPLRRGNKENTMNTTIRNITRITLSISVGVAAVLAMPAFSGDAAADDAELAKQLANPVAALISVPLQYNWDTNIGPVDADRSLLNIQPVIPFSLSEDWNLISRTIAPIIDAESTVAGGEDRSGLGDIAQSLFFSPKAPTERGWIWGVGPVFLLPTASDDALGTEKWSAGPTAVVLKQTNGWTYGLLGNHLWSFAGEDSRAEVNATFLQPFLSYTTKSSTTFTLNTESTYDWDAEQWTVPVNAMVSQLVKIGNQPVSFAFGYRNYVEAPTGGPEWGLRFVVTLLFPK
jgi:hypothetical protein